MKLNMANFLESYGLDVLFTRMIRGIFGYDVYGHSGDKQVGGDKKEDGKGEKKSEALHALASGKDMTDELLFSEACFLYLHKELLENPKLRVAKKEPTQQEINKVLKVCRAFSKFNARQRKRIVLWIGFDEVGVRDPKNPKSISYNNVRGEHIIEILTKMSEKEIFMYLKAAHTTDTPLDEVKETLAEVGAGIEKGLERIFGGQKNLKRLQRKAKSFRQRQQRLHNLGI
jgi:hypothetical protein